ncbi:MAG: prepilin-type N-terminal cleavage/methylation domain-containing protein [Lachnospiraceae bacterium]|nr:prepilin-type N-terminal cleavage/methylation domain-containing protein [Lachnospiraceae bacterium]
MINLRKNKAAGDNSGGYSLMELLVVMAIIAVTITFFLMGIRLMFTLPSRQCARQLKAALEKTRIDTMGRNAAGLRVYRTKKGIYVSHLETGPDGKTLSPEKEEKAGAGRVKVYYQSDSAGGYAELSDDNGVVLSFKRETGGLYGSAETHKIGDGGYTATGIKYFWTLSGGSVWRVSIAQLTGIIDIKKVDTVGDTSD